MTELFANFEVNRQPRWRAVAALLGLSAILHLALAASVLYVPTLRDAFNIAVLAGKSRYVDKAYTKTNIADDVRLVQIGSKFQYPPGYFAVGSAVAGTPATPGAPDPLAPKIISQAGPVKPETAALPTPSPNAVGSRVPGASPMPTVAPSPLVAEAKVKPKEPSEVDKQLDKIAKDNNVVRPDEDEINKRPLTDWLKKANEQKENNELDLSKVVEIKIEAQLDTDCKLSNQAVKQKSGDARLAELAKDLASAIGDSKVLAILRDPLKQKADSPPMCEAGPLSLALTLDEGEVTAEVAKQAESPERAAQLASTYNVMLYLGQQIKEGKVEEEIYKHTKIVAEGKQILVRFKMPRHTAAEMLTKQLKPGS